MCQLKTPPLVEFLLVVYFETDRCRAAICCRLLQTATSLSLHFLSSQSQSGCGDWRSSLSSSLQAGLCLTGNTGILGLVLVKVLVVVVFMVVFMMVFVMVLGW